MNATSKWFKAIARILAVLLLFQSCVVYHRTPTTLEKAAREQIKTKVASTGGETYRFDYITYEDGKYYGVNRSSGEWLKTPLDQTVITQAYLKNKRASTWATLATISVPVIAIALAIIIPTLPWGNDPIFVFEDSDAT
ncbi:hypothetical protein [Robiginitalea sp. SC105]|uniref:hypothetical protein n=1 Tax=Robiginitalea sp. SC105 TaxID=2762332 RepID=UPI001639E7CA|nr:hypothetical protein [Robiginitalea sp. SC105]MBC2838841.1 hypothetical protein [Robiginitalea sp. SC105]